MAIYRGLGGAGSNEQDASVSVITSKALEAAASAAAANTSKNEAASSATASANSATASAASAAAALVSENNASLSEATAAISAGLAGDSEAAAAASEAAAAASQLDAANSATAAATSETNAAASAAQALGIYGDAATQAASVAAAAASASAAALSESNALTSETNAAASESAAAISETNAATSESNAATSETNAAASAVAAAASETAAAASFDAFDDRYLGSKTSDPVVDNDGNALLTGALYFDSSSNVMKVWTGVNWAAAYASLSGAMFSANNLSDVSDVANARINLGLGSAATQDVSAFIAPNSTATLFNLTTTDGMEVGGSLVVTGNLTVNGTTTTVDTVNLAVADNMIYMNAGSTVTNPDLGFAGNYNNGTYAHAGFFRDATNGRWKPFDGYTPEPDASPEIDTSHASFNLASIEASTFYGNLVGNADTATSATTASSVPYSGLTGTVPTWNQNTTGNAATADYATVAGTANAVPYSNLTGTVPTWNQNTTGNAATADYATSAGTAANVPYSGLTGTVPTWNQNTTGSAASASQLSTGTWTVTESAGVLYFAVSGVNKAKLDSSGNLTVVGNVTAYGSV